MEANLSLKLVKTFRIYLKLIPTLLAILFILNVPLDSEQAAYLIGYLVGKMYYHSRRLFCAY